MSMGDVAFLRGLEQMSLEQLRAARDCVEVAIKEREGEPNIQRYELMYGGRCMEANPRGGWVHYDDMMEEINRIRAAMVASGVGSKFVTDEDGCIGGIGEEDEDVGPNKEDICSSAKEYYERLEAFVAAHPGASILSCDMPSHRLVGSCAYVEGGDAEEGEVMGLFYLPLHAIAAGSNMQIRMGREAIMTHIANGGIVSKGL